METHHDSLSDDFLLPEGVCPACEQGHMQPTVGPYEVDLGDNLRITVPNVPQEICDHCGEIAIGAEAARIIDAAIAEQTEQLTPRDLERIREDLGVDQTEMSEILGLGGKTYHRWEKGNQVPSRSMGYYLRTLAEFPEAFAWLRDRGWKKRNRLAVRAARIDGQVAFPDLAVVQRVTIVCKSARPNRALALYGKAA